MRFVNHYTGPRLLMFALAFGSTMTLSAHQQPMSTLAIDAGDKSVSVSLHVPLTELELAFGHHVTAQPLQSWRGDFETYLKAHIQPRSASGGNWTFRVLDMKLGKNTQAWSGTFPEVIVDSEWTPHAGADTRNFAIGYDVILHQVVTHKALVSIRSDWDGGRMAPVQAGVIAVDTGTAKIPPFRVSLGEGDWRRGFAGMIRLGVEHIREGTDHLLFLLVLLLPATLTVRGRRWDSFGGSRYSLVRLLKIVSAFTLGHSLTLLAGALHLFALPQQPVEVLIAVSILITAIHAIRPIFPGRETGVAAAFGLVHGMAFATVLAEMKLDAGRMALSILGFNLGIELMQLFVIAACAPWFILLSATAVHRYVRLTGALLASVAALGWIASRVTGQGNAIDHAMSSAPVFAPLCLALLAIVGSATYLYSAVRLPRMRMPIGLATAMSLALALVFTGYSLTSLHAQDFRFGARMPGILQSLTSAPRQAGVADVVAKALAFKALLSTTQQQALEQPYTQALARRWSNLPCAGTCRNGIQLGSLSAAQLAAALEVIQAAEGTLPNEGFDEFSQIRLADTVLANAGGAGGAGGGFSYGEGFYYLAFLNTPSTTGGWMLQFGGHHYGANIAFNQGHVVSTTPLFEALEPLSFTVSGTTYTPLAQERNALATMLASLSTTQLATAKLSQTFSDVTLSPGETNGGSGVFPSVKAGLAVSGLSAAQKLLVLEAMKPWVQDMDNTVAANLLTIYQNELDGTYISFTGNGVSGDASSFLVSNTNYARIDGPSVWIEFACQGGIVFRDQIHYHTIWRDHTRDYGQDLSLTVPLDSTASGAVTAVSAASFTAGSLAPEAIGTLFGTGLSPNSVSATSTPWPTTLNGIQVQVKDSTGTTRNAPVYFVSPTQISFQNPQGTASGAATLTVIRDGVTVGQGTLVVESVTPGLFSANATGQGVAAAQALRVKADGTQTVEQLIQVNSATNKFEAVPLNLGAATDQVYLIAFGTGFRNRSALSAVTATIGGTAASPIFAGAQGTFIGLDQANILIPRSLAGRGDVNVVLTVDGKTSNTVTINIQ